MKLKLVGLYPVFVTDDEVFLYAYRFEAWFPVRDLIEQYDTIDLVTTVLKEITKRNELYSIHTEDFEYPVESFLDLNNCYVFNISTNTLCPLSEAIKNNLVE